MEGRGAAVTPTKHSGWRYGSQTHACSATNCRAVVTLMTTCLVAEPRVELGRTGLWGPRGGRSSPQCLEQATGFEPVYPTWQAGVMATIRCLHFGTSAEIQTLIGSLGNCCPVPLNDGSIIGASRGNRTHNLLLTRQLPYRLAREAFWCPTRVSNPQETDFESVMSAVCINRTNLQMKQSRFCPSATCFHVPRPHTVPPTSFCLSSVLALRTGLEPAPFGLEDRCTSCCAYGACLVTLQGIEPCFTG